jgi:elongator complex protein 3
MVIEHTELEKWQQEERYQPYPDDVMITLIAEMKKNVPSYVRISRVLRDIPSEYITGGLKNSIRDGVKDRLKAEGSGCRCIRCREYGHRPSTAGSQPSLRRLEYDAAGGKEIFLSFEDETDTLYGLLRLRIQDGHTPQLQWIDGKIALIRELHVYGPELQFGVRGKDSAQHRGFGRELLREAEQIAKIEYGLGFIAVLSGVGARNYYRESGYEFNSGYMVKPLR